MIHFCISQSFCYTFLYNKVMLYGFEQNRIKELREERGLSQRQLANEIATSQANLSRWEKSVVDPCISECWKLADYFNVTIDYLCGRSDY